MRNLALSSLVALLAVGTSLASAAPLRTEFPPDGVRDFSTLKQGELTTLPRTTKIKLPKTGRIVSIADLYKEHDARMARFANASALGRSMLGRLREPAPLSLRGAMVPPNRLRPRGIASATPSTEPVGLSAAALQFHLSQNTPQLLPTETKDESSGTIYAKDYDDFCSQAKASACIYFPQDMLQALPVGNFNGMSYVFDTDYLVTPQQCEAGYGFYTSANACYYPYPTQSTVRWTETTPPTATVSGSCLNPDGSAQDPFQSVYDHYGVFQLGFANEALQTPSAYTCVVQIKAVPA